MCSKITKIAILGAGISGMAAAFRLQQISSNFKVVIFQKQNHIGGRTYTKKLAQNQIFDEGANFITLDSLIQPERTIALWKLHFSKDLVKIKKPLYIYQNNCLQIGDHQTEKYSYNKGIQQFCHNIKQKLIRTRIELNQEVRCISKQNNNWMINAINKQQQYKQLFDILIVSIPKPSLQKIFLNQYLGQSQIQYSYQITASFYFQKQQIPYSCILFKNHNSITFICSHQQKTDSKGFFNIQMNNQFSKKFWNSENKQIQQQIQNQIPKQLFCGSIIFKSIKKWYPSLRTNNKKIQDNPQIKLYWCGDSKLQRSRILSCFQSGIKLADKIGQSFNKELIYLKQSQ